MENNILHIISDTSVKISIDKQTLSDLLKLTRRDDDLITLLLPFLPLIATLITGFLIWYTNKKTIENAVDVAEKNIKSSEKGRIYQAKIDSHNRWAQELRTAASNFSITYRLESENSRVLVWSNSGVAEADLSISNEIGNNQAHEKRTLFLKIRDDAWTAKDKLASERVAAQTALFMLVSEQDPIYGNIVTIIKGFISINKEFSAISGSVYTSSDAINDHCKTIIAKLAALETQLRDEVRKVTKAEFDILTPN